MSKACKFIDHYNKLDELFAKDLDQEVFMSFRDKVIYLAVKDLVVKRYRNNFFQLMNLRDAIAHKSNKIVPIAEPFEMTIQLIQMILEQFEDSKRLIPSFQIEVFTIAPYAPLITLLQEMKTQNFSQVPILDAYGKLNRSYIKQ